MEKSRDAVDEERAKAVGELRRLTVNPEEKSQLLILNSCAMQMIQILRAHDQECRLQIPEPRS
jgi:hypothetical protein